jgi:MOSC domain-containing protein YiiM
LIMSGEVAQLFIKPGHRQPMRPVSKAQAVAGQGLSGDASFGRSKRQVLLVEAEVLDRFDLKPGSLRENLTVRGVRLTGLPGGTVLTIGETSLQITGDCAPCRRLEETRPGLQRAIGGWRGQLARVVAGGVIRVGDPVTISPPTNPGSPDET